MSKSLNELFGLLANAGAPRSAEEYKSSLAGIRTKVKNSSTCLQADEADKAKCIAENLGVDKNGKTPLSKVFSKPKITNAGNSAGAVAGWLKRKGQAESLGKEAARLGQKANDSHRTSDHQAAADANSKAAQAMRGVATEVLTTPGLSGQNLMPAHYKLNADAREHDLTADDHRRMVISTAPQIKPTAAYQPSHHPDHPPVSNVQGGWMYHPEGETYSSESSQLTHSNRQDPWGRPLLMRYLKQHGDDDGDVTHWSGTIQAPPASMGTLGKAAKIKIFND